MNILASLVAVLAASACINPGDELSQARATGGGILLFHDIHANTADSLDALLTALEADGF